MSGRGEESAFRPNWKFTGQSSSPPYSAALKPELHNDVIKKKQLNHFHLRWPRNLLHIRRQDKVSDKEVLTQTNFPSIIIIMSKAQLRWAGHVSHMPGRCHSEAATLCGDLRRRAKKTIQRQPESLDSLKDFNISTESWQFLASDRPSMCNSIVKGAHTAEERRSLQAEQERATLKARATSTNITASTHLCPTCGRGFLSRIGLISRLGTCRSSSSTN